MSRFQFTAYANFQDQPAAHPGKIFDRTDQDGISGVPMGGPAPHGRVLVSGISAHGATNAGLGLTDKYFTKEDSVSLPDKAGAHLKDYDTGLTYAASGLTLPVDANGDLIIRGIGMWTEHGSQLNTGLAQPFGLGEHCYQAERVYTETDIQLGDELYFRHTIGNAAQLTDGVVLLGAFAANQAGNPNFQKFPHGSVFRPGPAGGLFVINLNKAAF